MGLESGPYRLTTSVAGSIIDSNPKNASNMGLVDDNK